MTIHKEANVSLFVWLLGFLILLAISYFFFPKAIIPIVIVHIITLGFLLWFFRKPNRPTPPADNSIVYAPADGKVVTIEKVHEPEFLKDERIQVSIFMSPLNVHINRNPVGGKVEFYKYHSGKYLAAWNPKSSTENERTTTVIDTGKDKVLFRQIAGALARRIVSYVKTGDQVKQADEMGFIKLGSRVDVYLPLNAEVMVQIGDKVEGPTTVIAKL